MARTIYVRGLPAMRTYYVLVGLATFAGVGSLVLAFGPDDVWGLLTVAALSLAAGLFVVGGLVGSISIGPRTVRWYHPVGAGIVLVGVAMGVPFVEEVVGSSGASMGAFVNLLAALLLLFIGVDFSRGGAYHDLSAGD